MFKSLQIALVLSCCLAPPARPQETTRIEAPPHPLLLGPLSDAGSALAGNLNRHADALDGLEATPAIRYLSVLQNGGALDQISAQILARVIVEPQAAGRLLSQNPSIKIPRTTLLRDAAALRGLVEAARANSMVENLIAGIEPTADLEDLSLSDDQLLMKGRQLAALGRGAEGKVYVHPKIPGAAIKAFRSSYPAHEIETPAAKNSIQIRTDREVRAGRLVASAGAGPRILASPKLLETSIVVKEMVFGKTVYDYAQKKGAYGKTEHRLVLEMLDRLVEARLDPPDLHRGNVVIGNTQLDPERRAYLVDGGPADNASPTMRLPDLKKTIGRHLGLGMLRLISQETQVMNGTLNPWPHLKMFLRSKAIKEAMEARR